MKWIAHDISLTDGGFTPWRKHFAWLPITIEEGYKIHRYWLCHIERRSRKFRGIIWPENIYTTYEYRPIADSTDEKP